jgi:hypothetical protein
MRKSTDPIIHEERVQEMIKDARKVLETIETLESNYSEMIEDGVCGLKIQTVMDHIYHVKALVINIIK